MSSNEQGFYITLPSESSKELFPENNPSEYTVRLPRWIHLKGNWEIGLHSIVYTPWNIIQPFDDPISFTAGGEEGKGGKMRKHYGSVQEYVSDINKSLKESHVDKSKESHVDKSKESHVDKSNEIVFILKLNGKVKVNLSPGYSVRLRREQAIVLGFMTFEDSAEVYVVKNTETGPYKANLYRETNIHIYCDIVQAQIVGDKMTPLVAVVPCQETYDTYETLYAVENIHYIPVRTKSFQNIKVHLRSSTNEPIPFEHGRATITLHLRPLNYFE